MPSFIWIILMLIVLLPVVWVLLTHILFSARQKRLTTEKEALEITLIRYYNVLMQHIRALSKFIAYQHEAFDELSRWRLSTDDRLSLKMNERYFTKMLTVEKVLVEVYQRHPELLQKPIIKQLFDDYHLVHTAFMRHRRRLNAMVASYNAFITSFPHNVLAKFFQLSTERFFKTEPLSPIDEKLNHLKGEE